MEDEIKNEETQGETREEETEEPIKPLEKMTAPELREVALEMGGITGVHAMKKEELLELIKEAKGIKEEAPAKKRKAVKEDLSVKALKGKIIQLKEEKASARTEKDKKRVDVLRRRINRLKKQTRKVANA